MNQLNYIYLLKHDWMQGISQDTSYTVGFALTKVEADVWLSTQKQKDYATIEVLNRREKIIP